MSSGGSCSAIAWFPHKLVLSKLHKDEENGLSWDKLPQISEKEELKRIGADKLLNFEMTWVEKELCNLRLIVKGKIQDAKDQIKLQFQRKSNDLLFITSEASISF